MVSSLGKGDGGAVDAALFRTHECTETWSTRPVLERYSHQCELIVPDAHGNAYGTAGGSKAEAQDEEAIVSQRPIRCLPPSLTWWCSSIQTT